MSYLIFIASICLLSSFAWSAEHQKHLSLEQFNQLYYSQYALDRIVLPGNRHMYAQDFATNIIKYATLKKNQSVDMYHESQKILDLALDQYPHNPFLLNAGLYIFDDMNRKDLCCMRLLKYQDPSACHSYASKKIENNEIDCMQHVIDILKKNVSIRLVGMISRGRNTKALVYQHKPSLVLLKKIYHDRVYLPAVAETVPVEKKWKAMNDLLDQMLELELKDHAIVLFSQIIEQMIRQANKSALDSIRSSVAVKKLRTLAKDDFLCKLTLTRLDNQPLDSADMFLVSDNAHERECGLTIYNKKIIAEKDEEKQQRIINRLLNVLLNNPKLIAQQIHHIEKKNLSEWRTMPAGLFLLARFLVDHDNYGTTPGEFKKYAFGLIHSMKDVYPPAASYCTALSDQTVSIQYVSTTTPVFIQSQQKLVNNQGVYTDAKDEVVRLNDCIKCMPHDNQNTLSDQKNEAKSASLCTSNQCEVNELYTFISSESEESLDKKKIEYIVESLKKVITCSLKKDDEYKVQLIVDKLFIYAKRFHQVYPVLIEYFFLETQKLLSDTICNVDQLARTIIQLHSSINTLRNQYPDISAHVARSSKITDKAVQECFKAKKIILGIELMESQNFISRGHASESELWYKLVPYWLRFAHIKPDMAEKALDFCSVQAGRSDISALRTIVVSAFHGLTNYEQDVKDALLQLIKYDPLFALQAFDDLYRVEAIHAKKHSECVQYHNNFYTAVTSFVKTSSCNDVDVINWLCATVKKSGPLETSLANFTIPSNYPYLLPYQAAACISIDKPTEKEYLQAVSTIDTFINYLDTKKVRCNDYDEFAIEKALQVLEKMPLAAMNHKDVLHRKLHLIYHTVRFFDAHGSAASIKKRLMKLCNAQDPLVDYESYHLHGGNFNINPCLVRAGRFLVHYDSLVVAQNDNESKKEKIKGIVYCFQDIKKLIYEFVELLPEEKQVNLKRMMVGIVQDIMQAPLSNDDKIVLLEDIVAYHLDQVYCVQALMKLYAQTRQFDKVHTLYARFAQEEASGKVAHIVGMTMIQGDAMSVDGVVVNYGKGKNEKVRIKEGVEWIKKAAKKKSTQALMQLGKWHLEGKYGFSRNYKSACEYFDEIADISQLNMHDLYAYAFAQYKNKNYVNSMSVFHRIVSTERLLWLKSRLFLFSIAHSMYNKSDMYYLKEFYDRIALAGDQFNADEQKELFNLLQEHAIEKKIESALMHVQKKGRASDNQELSSENNNNNDQRVIFWSESEHNLMWLTALHSYIKCEFKYGSVAELKKMQSYLEQCKNSLYAEERLICHVILGKIQVAKLFNGEKDARFQDLEKLYTLLADIALKCEFRMLSQDIIIGFATIYTAGMRWLLRNNYIEQSVTDEKMKKIKMLLIVTGIMNPQTDNMVSILANPLAFIAETFFNRESKIKK